MEILRFNKKSDFYKYMNNNINSLNEVFVVVKRGNPALAGDTLAYLDAVEVALCFGWIDSVLRNIDGELVQRFSPRRKNCNWTELNKERARRLIRLGEMTDYGKKVLPNLDEKYVEPIVVLEDLKKNKEAYQFFLSTPKLYQRIKLSYLYSCYLKDKTQYKKGLENLILKSLNHKYVGEWNDYGRLL